MFNLDIDTLILNELKLNATMVVNRDWYHLIQSKLNKIRRRIDALFNWRTINDITVYFTPNNKLIYFEHLIIKYHGYLIDTPEYLKQYYQHSNLNYQDLVNRFWYSKPNKNQLEADMFSIMWIKNDLFSIHMRDANSCAVKYEIHKSDLYHLLIETFYNGDLANPSYYGGNTKCSIKI